jgi:hypothetical protein
VDLDLGGPNVTPKKEGNRRKSLNGWRHFQKLGNLAYRPLKI